MAVLCYIGYVITHLNFSVPDLNQACTIACGPTAKATCTDTWYDDHFTMRCTTETIPEAIACIDGKNLS